MGMWGFHSWEGDGTMDFVGGMEYLTSQKKVNAILKETWAAANVGFEKVGVVCYILRHGRWDVPVSKLKEALKISQGELDPDLLSDWRSVKQRGDAVKAEIVMLEQAIAKAEKKKKEAQTGKTKAMENELIWAARFFATPDFTHMRVSDDLALLKRALKKEYGISLKFRKTGSNDWDIYYGTCRIGEIGKVQVID